MMTNLAPVVVTAYNRPDNLSSLLGSLISNPESTESDLYLFIDGPKNRFDADLIQQVNSNAKIFKSYFKSFNIFQNEKNLGFRSQIMNIGNLIFQSKKAAIFVEDDLILSSTFLRFMNESLYKFEKDLNQVLKKAGLNLKAPIKKAILSALGTADSEAEICRDSKGNPEPDSNLRDTEIVPLPNDIALPLPLDYSKDGSVNELVKLVKEHCEEYFKKEVLPHVPDAWIDFDKTKVGYEIPLNRHFYVYQPPRGLDVIEDDIKALESDIMAMLAEVV
jgi:hypothetical protein